LIEDWTTARGWRWRDGEPVDPGIGRTRCGLTRLRARWPDWDPIRGLHHGPRS